MELQDLNKKNYYKGVKNAFDLESWVIPMKNEFKKPPLTSYSIGQFRRIGTVSQPGKCDVKTSVHQFSHDSSQVHPVCYMF